MLHFEKIRRKKWKLAKKNFFWPQKKSAHLSALSKPIFELSYSFSFLAIQNWIVQTNTNAWKMQECLKWSRGEYFKIVEDLKFFFRCVIFIVDFNMSSEMTKILQFNPWAPFLSFLALSWGLIRSLSNSTKIKKTLSVENLKHCKISKLTKTSKVSQIHEICCPGVIFYRWNRDFRQNKFFCMFKTKSSKRAELSDRFLIWDSKSRK